MAGWKVYKQHCEPSLQAPKIRQMDVSGWQRDRMCLFCVVVFEDFLKVKLRIYFIITYIMLVGTLLLTGDTYKTLESFYEEYFFPFLTKSSFTLSELFSRLPSLWTSFFVQGRGLHSHF